MDPYVGEIKPFAGNFAPRGWAFCDGQIMPISTNTALFSLLGTVYGGDGKTNFALPDLRARTPMHQGHGAGLTPRELGEPVGSETIALKESEMPLHHHSAQCNDGASDTDIPIGAIWSNSGSRGQAIAYNNEPDKTKMSSKALHPSGGEEPHNNRQPYTGLNYIIALQGTYPPRP